MTPETERRFVRLAVARGQVPERALAALEQARATGPARQRSLPRLACDAGLISKPEARALLHELRAAHGVAPAPGEPSTVRGLIEPITLPEAPAPLLTGPPEALAPRPASHDSGALVPGAPLGPYVVQGVLGRGGMGVVYRALDRRLGREVALKTILGNADPDAIERFDREARAAGRIRHPNVVAVHDHGVIAGTRFLALELVDGGTLQGRIRKEGPLAAAEAARAVAELARGVQAAHDAGVLHRDLKPANVLLEKDGRPRLTDFGLARDERAVDLTHTGDVLGTPVSMAPEQANGDRKAIGPGTDVYGLGAVLFEALTGEPPFQGKSGLEVLQKVLLHEPRSPSAVRAAKKLLPVARDLETICLKCLEKDPARRYASASELADDLGRFLAGEPVVARPLGFLARAGRQLRRGLAAPGTLRQARELQKAAAVLVVAAVVGGVSAWGVHAPAAAAAAAAADAAAAAAAAADDATALTKLDAVIAEHAEAARTQPAFFPLWERRGLLRLEKGDRAGAVVDLEQALRLAPATREGAHAFASLGRARLALGDAPGAEAALTRALELDPASPFVRHARARARLAKGDLDGALADYDQAHAAAPFDAPDERDFASALEGFARTAPPADAERARARLARPPFAR